MRWTLACICTGAIAMTTCSAWSDSSPPRYFNMPMFYIWYTSDEANHKTGWNGGVLETPLAGYYDSRDYRTAYDELKALAEWGFNVACLSWWGPHQDSIVDTYARAARALRAQGYNVWLTCYVEDHFSYQDLESNARPGTMLHHALRRYVARYPDVFARIDGEPFLVIYGRCGVPQHPVDHEGFRAFLQGQYETIDRLNEAWKTSYRGFGEVEHAPGAPGGWLRAESLRYSVALLERRYRGMNEALRAEGLPPVRLCADIGGFEPTHSGFAAVTRIFGGVHTYNDMALPEERDRACFAYSQAAKHFVGLFFAHVKARYNDSAHRVPGFIYAAEPAKFDRWFTWALLQRSDKVQHPSWNEFWEGSNIEPSLEYKKKWVEKNEFYSSILDECWEDMRRRDTASDLAVVFNEWAPLYMGKAADDLWAVIETLRRLDQEFVLLPETLATPEHLERFRVVIAPSCGVGFGYNEQGERVADALLRWIRSGRGKRLLLSYAPDMAEQLGVTIIKRVQATTALRWVLDVGGPADAEGIWGGWRGRETWGSGDERRTVRWTNSKWSNVLLPTAPGHDYTLRITAEWHHPCRGRIYVNDQQVGEFEGEFGRREMEFRVPSQVIGQSVQSHLDIEHEALWVPAEVGRGADTSALGIAVDVIEIAAAGHENDPVQSVAAQEEVVFEKAIWGMARGSRLLVPGSPWKDVIKVPADAVLARYGDGTPRLVQMPVRGNQVIYENGLTSAALSADVMSRLLADWAGLEVWKARVDEALLVTRLRSGGTTILAVANTAGKARSFEVPLASENGVPLAAVRCLTRDGRPGKWLWRDGPAPDVLRDKVQWCGVYEIVHAPVAAQMPELALAPGGRYRVEVALRNLTDARQQGTLTVVGPPSLRCDPMPFNLGPRETRLVPLTLTTGEFLDWGRRTVRVQVSYEGGRATFWHFVKALRPAQVRPLATAFHVPAGGGSVRVSLRNDGEATASDVTLHIGARTASFGDIGGGKTATRAVRLEVSDKPQEAQISYHVQSVAQQHQFRVRVAAAPQERGWLVVTNPLGVKRERALVRLPQPIPAGVSPMDGDSALPITRVGGPAALVNLEPWQSKRIRLAAEHEGVPAGVGVREQSLGTGAGTVDIETDCFAIVFDEAMGGAVRSFVPKPGTADYGAGSFGVEYRLGDRVISQFRKPGQLRVVSRDQFGVEVESRWRDSRISVTQTWRIYAHQPWLELHVEATPTGLLRGAVVTLLNTRLRRNDIRRIYPGFTTLGENTGWQPDTKQMHFGWKEYWGEYVPDAWVAFETDANDVRQALAVICRTPDVIAGFRQGFYPERPEGIPPAVDSAAAAPGSPWAQAQPRYEPGVAALCEIEAYAVARGRVMQADFVLYSFSGYWDKFKEFLQQLQAPPLAQALPWAGW